MWTLLKQNKCSGVNCVHCKLCVICATARTHNLIRSAMPCGHYGFCSVGDGCQHCGSCATCSAGNTTQVARNARQKIKLDWQQPSIQFISVVQTVVVSLQVQKAINLFLKNVEKTLEEKSFKGHKADIQLLRDVIRSYYINDLFKIDLMSEVAIHMRSVRGKYWIYISDWMGINRDDRYLVPLEELPLRRSLRIASRTVLSKLADRRRTRMKKN